MKEKTIELNYFILENASDILKTLCSKNKYIFEIHNNYKNILKVFYLNDKDRLIDKVSITKSYNLYEYRDNDRNKDFFSVSINFKDSYYVAIYKEDLVNFLKLYFNQYYYYEDDSCVNYELNKEL